MAITSESIEITNLRHSIINKEMAIEIIQERIDRLEADIKEKRGMKPPLFKDNIF